MDRTDRHTERPTDPGETGDAPEFITPDDALADARRTREQSKDEQESTSEIDKRRESGFGA